MRSVRIYLLCIVLFFSGCKTVKRVFGFEEGEQKQPSKSTPVKIVPPSPEKRAITSTTLSNWALYSVITLGILLAIRYGVKKITDKE